MHGYYLGALLKHLSGELHSSVCRVFHCFSFHLFSFFFCLVYLFNYAHLDFSGGDGTDSLTQHATTTTKMLAGDRIYSAIGDR